MATVAIRQLKSADRQVLTALIELVGKRGELDGFAPEYGEEIAQFLTSQPADTAVAAAGERVIGFVAPEPKWLAVHPEHRRRGIGRRLVRAGLAIERQRRRPNLLLAPVIGKPSAFAFLQACGFRHHSSVWDFVLDPHVEVPAPRLAPGLKLRPFVPDLDDATYLETFNRAFAEHATPVQISHEVLEQIKRDPQFDPSDSVLVVRSDAPQEAIGVCIVSVVRRAGLVVKGDLSWVGVVPEARGEGLGRELLRWGIQRLRRAGVPELTLSVNATNSRALGLYERTGFRRVGERPRWALPVTPRLREGSRQEAGST